MNDGATVISAMTMDSKMSKMESRFDRLEDLLHTFMGKTSLGSTGAPPPVSSNVEAASIASAIGG